ncbi:MAG: UbiA-like polyprenyltransferase [Phycisphaeraceae bacterium]|nr:UbiA-like polyprenyltransferase [Phycisphaeraceae bacterium]
MADSSLLVRCRAVAADIKLAHSLFALPFALLAMCLAAAWADRWPTGIELGLVLLCMVLGRTVAMTANRFADAEIDAANPRTTGRAVPAGRVSRRFMGGTMGLAGLGFVIASAGFWMTRGNIWPLVLSPLVLAWLVGYSWTKRFTWLCHVFLGAALALSPLAAGIAIEPGWLATPVPWLLALMVTGWVAGFDVIYALQDVDFDREQGLHSMPSSLGVEPALWLARVFHLVALASLIGAGWFSSRLGVPFAVATGAVAGLLILEHALVAGGETRRLDMAFFTVNGVISLLLGAAGAWDALHAISG